LDGSTSGPEAFTLVQVLAVVVETSPISLRTVGRNDLGDAKIALVGVETLKIIGKVILGIIGMLLFILPDAIGTFTKLLRRVREFFRT
jgi:hypothetical protein